MSAFSGETGFLNYFPRSLLKMLMKAQYLIRSRNVSVVRSAVAKIFSVRRRKLEPKLFRVVCFPKFGVLSVVIKKL